MICHPGNAPQWYGLSPDICGRHLSRPGVEPGAWISPVVPCKRQGRGSIPLALPGMREWRPWRVPCGLTIWHSYTIEMRPFRLPVPIKCRASVSPGTCCCLLPAPAEDPTSGGRHKVLGSKALNIPPQTSTIASHLPKAVGAAYSIGAAKRHAPEHQQLADDSIVMCSFGDASANHSTAQGAFNTAGWTAVQSTPLPLLFVCEDNGIGISTKTPRGWI